MRKLTLLVSILLSGCAVLAPTSATVQSIEWVRLDTREEVVKACARYTGEAQGRAKGIPRLRLSVDHSTLGCFRRTADRCIVITLKPRLENAHDIERESDLGAEVRHCFEGLFH